MKQIGVAVSLSVQFLNAVANWSFKIAGLYILTVLFVPPAEAINVLIESPIFYWDSPQVTISPGELSATFVESPDFTPVVLSTDQPWGATGLQLPANADTLSFEYDFVEAPGNDDSFNATIYGYNSATILKGPEFWETSAAGTWTWNVAGLAGTLIGLEFQLFSNDDFYDSTLAVANIAVAANGAAPIPEPGTLLLLGSGIAGLAGFRRKYFR